MTSGLFDFSRQYSEKTDAHGVVKQAIGNGKEHGRIPKPQGDLKGEGVSCTRTGALALYRRRHPHHIDEVLLPPLRIPGNRGIVVAALSEIGNVSPEVLTIFLHERIYGLEDVVVALGHVPHPGSTAVI